MIYDMKILMQIKWNRKSIKNTDKNKNYFPLEIGP